MRADMVFPSYSLTNVDGVVHTCTVSRHSTLRATGRYHHALSYHMMSLSHDILCHSAAAAFYAQNAPDEYRFQVHMTSLLFGVH